MFRELLATTSAAMVVAGTAVAQQTEGRAQEQDRQTQRAAPAPAGGLTKHQADTEIRVDSLRGASVVSQQGVSLGAIRDVLVDDRGQLVVVVSERDGDKLRSASRQPPRAQEVGGEQLAKEQVAESGPVEFITAQEQGQILANDAIDLSVMGRNGKEIGKIGDVLFDAEGSIAGAVLHVGGFLGVGEKRVAVPWKQVNFSAVNQIAAVDVAIEHVEAAPEFKTIGEIRKEQEAQRAQQRAQQ